MAPNLCFRVDQLDVIHGRRSADGDWLPSRRNSNHSILPEGRRIIRLGDGDASFCEEGDRNLPPATMPAVQCYSMYRCASGRIILVNGDTTQDTIGSGEDFQESEDDEDGAVRMNGHGQPPDWEELRLVPYNTPTGRTYRYCSHSTTWPDIVTDTASISSFVMPHACSRQVQAEMRVLDALCGDLAALLGLLVLALPVSQVERLPTLLRGPWQWPAIEDTVCARCRDREPRGVIVRMWLQNEQDDQALKEFQQGSKGSIIQARAGAVAVPRSV